MEEIDPNLCFGRIYQGSVEVCIQMHKLLEALLLEVSTTVRSHSKGQVSAVGTGRRNS